MSTFYATVPMDCLPCCNAAPHTITMECRTIGGTASLCGFSEYTTPSIPPAKYLKQSVTGDIGNWDHDATYTGVGVCSGYEVGKNISGNKCVESGVCSYDPNTCVLTNGLTRNCSGRISEVVSLAAACGLSAPSPRTAPSCSPYAPSMIGSSVIIITPTVTQWGADGVCYDMGVNDWRIYSVCGTPVTATLYDMDTEANAITRLKAISNYTSWTNVGDGTGGTCLKTNCCQSVYEARSSFNFSYTESQYRCNVFGLANSTAYTLIIEAWRSLHGAANYALYSYALTPFTTNATGFGTVIGDVPITLGYDTYVTSPDLY